MRSIALVTGASRGLGLAVSKLLLAEGYTVLGASKTQKHWKSAIKAAKSPEFTIEQVDVTDEKQVKSWIASAAKKGSIKVVINNAGYGGRLASIDQTSLSEFSAHLNLNLVSAFLVCKHVIPFMKKDGSGCILNISSMAGKRAVPRLAGYSASKFGVIALSQAVAKENPDDIFCVTVCPGGMNTEMRASLFGKEDASRQQSPEFVAQKMMEILNRRIPVPNGSDIVIRHGKITSIDVPPSN